MSLHVKTTLLGALMGRTSQQWSRMSEVEQRAKIRFDDNSSAVVWQELSAESGLGLVPVRDIETKQLMSEIDTLRNVYTSDPRYVFLHVSVSERETNGVVVSAIAQSYEYTLLHAVASAPVADTIAAIALALPVNAVYFIWNPHRLSLARHYLLRWMGKRTAFPLDTMWLIQRENTGKEAPQVLIRCEV